MYNYCTYLTLRCQTLGHTKFLSHLKFNFMKIKNDRNNWNSTTFWKKLALGCIHGDFFTYLRARRAVKKIFRQPIDSFERRGNSLREVSRDIHIWNLNRLTHMYVLAYLNFIRVYLCSPHVRNLAKQLTLSQPGGQIISTTVLRAPPEFQTLRQACFWCWNS